MAIIASKTWLTNTGQFGLSFTDDLQVTADELYKTTPLCTSNTQQTFNNNNSMDSAYEIQTLSLNYYGRSALYIDQTYPTDFIKSYDNTVVFKYKYRYGGSGAYYWQYNQANFDSAFQGVANVKSGIGTFATNIPVFSTYAQAQAYCLAQTQSQALNALKLALNWKDSTIEEDSEFLFVNNYGVLQKWTVDGQEEVHSSSLIYRTFKMKVTAGKLSFYKIEGIDGDSLKAGIKYSDDFQAISIGYSEDGGRTYTYVESLPYDFIYRTRENELGEFYACPVDATKLDTNILLFEDETTAEGYIDGTVDPTDALNWGVVSQYTDITNGTGTSDDQTEFGEVYAKNFFSQVYLCGATAIQEIANALFDTDATGITHFWEKIKEGVEMYGNDPMQSVQGLTYFPVNLTTLFTNYSSQQYVYFGGYKLDLSTSINRLIFPDGYKTLGTFVLKKTFKNWRDYEPFCKAYIFLPYVGTYQLDLARYYDKTTEVRYYIDVRTGGCVACLIADGVLTDYYNGQMGVQMPITLTDKSSYANAQIETLLGGLKHEGSVLQGAGTTGSAGGSAGMYVAVAQATAGTMLNASMTTYKLTENNINNYNKTKGGSSSMLNEYLPQYVTLMLEIQQDDPTENHDMLLGKPTNASGTVGSFSGFLQVDSVNLQCGIATPNEKKEILSALLNGIFI